MSTPTRTLFIAWQDPATRAIHPIARMDLRDQAPRFELRYITGIHLAVAAGFVPFARMSRLDASYFTDDLRSFPLTANRLMPPSRSDFSQHLERLGLPGSAEPIQILARSEGRRATDNLEFFAMPERDDVTGRWVYRAFVRGVRHVPGADAAIAALRPGQRLTILPDPGNEWDPRALVLGSGNGQRIGFLPGVLLDDIQAARQTGASIDVVVERVNPAPAPVQQRVLMRITIGCSPEFEPFASERFKPFAPSQPGVHRA